MVECQARWERGVSRAWKIPVSMQMGAIGTFVRRQEVEQTWCWNKSPHHFALWVSSLDWTLKAWRKQAVHHTRSINSWLWLLQTTTCMCIALWKTQIGNIPQMYGMVLNMHHSQILFYFSLVNTHFIIWELKMSSAGILHRCLYLPEWVDNSYPIDSKFCKVKWF